MGTTPNGEAEHEGGRNQVATNAQHSSEVLKELRSDPSAGLTQEEAESRLAKYGYNEVPERRVNPAIRLARKFWGLTSWMLELVMVFSFALQRYLDFYIIAALLVVNAVIGFAQEQKASSAVEALRKRLQISARVLRDGRWRVIAARELVPGDIVRVRTGDFVPADLKIIDETELSVDQSALTGESMTVDKRQDDPLYSGTILKRGETTAVVTATSIKTFFGKTTELLQVAKPKLHMEEIVSSIVRWLLVMVGTLIAVVLAVSYAEGVEVLQVIPLALVLIVFAVPVALPAMFTVSMALGSQELARKGVLVTRLSASEDAASMDTLCADKTGTITTNRLSIANVMTAEGFDDNRVVLYGALASQEANQDPIDLAFVFAARERGLPVESYVQRQFIPFDPSTRRTEAVIAEDGREFKVTKGAVEVVAERCGLSLEQEGIRRKMDDFAARGYRTLAIAISEHCNGFRLAGLVALYDMPRSDSRQLIRELRELGVSVKMLTGDALPVAREISRQVGLEQSVLSAVDLRTEMEKDRAKAAEIVEGNSVFAEVYPEDKYAIVKSLQTKRHIAGMTGDGVNDAPALRQAEVGIAVSNATDVAKGAASAVLTTEGLSSIVELVKTGRVIYQRIVTWVLNKVVKTFEVAVFIALAFLLTGYYVVSALDIVILLFAVDFVTISLSTDTVRWSKRPDRWNVAALVKVGALLGVFTVLELFVLLFAGLKYLGLSANVERLHTFTFAALFYLGLFTVLIVRERRPFWYSSPSRTLLVATVVDMILVALLVTVGIPGVTPIPVTYLGVVVGYVLVLSLAVNDRIKHGLMKWSGIGM